MLRTRVTLIAGFLGAGKTTLLNALLAQSTEPLGVIVNDFGTINVDAALVAGQAAVLGEAAEQSEVALQNGCICCTRRGDLLIALLSLTRRPRPPRHIVIEASGVSDPAAIARTFLDPRLSDCIELSAVIGCVDPCQLSSLVADDGAVAREQLRACDFVVLTRADVSTSEQRAAARQEVQRLAPQARLVSSSLTHAPTALLLGAQGLWDAARTAAVTPGSPETHVHEAGAHHHHHHHHGHAFETWSYVNARPLSIYAVRRALTRLPTAVYRAKGFVFAAEKSEQRLLVQVAGARAELRAEGTWGSEAPRTQLVLLGHEGTLPTDALTALFDGCEHDGRPQSEGFMDEMLGYFDRVARGVAKHSP